MTEPRQPEPRQPSAAGPDRESGDEGHVKDSADAGQVGGTSGGAADRRPEPPDRPAPAHDAEALDQPSATGATATGASAGEQEWDPTGLDLARSVLGSLTNGTASGRRGGSAAGSGGRGRNGRGSRARGHRGLAGQAAYADIAGTSSAYPDDRDPQVLDSTIERLVADRGWNTDVAVAGALARWDQIVGPQIAEHCKAERYAEGVLTVRADSTAWATQVRLLAATLVKRLNEDLGDGTVDRIVVQGPAGYDWRKRGLGTRDARGPRDTFG